MIIYKARIEIMEAAMIFGPLGEEIEFFQER